MGLETLDSSAILWVFSIDTPLDDDAAFAFADAQAKALMENVRVYVEGEDGTVDWVYMNYADRSQNPILSYGEGNVAFLRKVSERVDPEGWWQRMVPGGFKLANVGRG